MSKVTLDIMHGKERTMTGKITSPILVNQHLWVTFCRKEWLMEHVNTQINEIVVMYLSAEKVIRPPAPPDVSVCKGIMSCFSFLFLGVPRHCAKRSFNCWCKLSFSHAEWPAFRVSAHVMENHRDLGTPLLSQRYSISLKNSRSLLPPLLLYLCTGV
jgi:hypothetical protein